MKTTATFTDGTKFRFDPLESIERNECLPGSIESLHRDRHGYVIVRTFTYLDGKKLGPEDEWAKLVPELSAMGANEMRLRRLRCKHHARRVSVGSAVAWCARTCLPRELIGYVIDCIDVNHSSAGDTMKAAAGDGRRKLTSKEKAKLLATVRRTTAGMSRTEKLSVAAAWEFMLLNLRGELNTSTTEFD